MPGLGQDCKLVSYVSTPWIACAQTSPERNGTGTWSFDVVFEAGQARQSLRQGGRRRNVPHLCEVTQGSGGVAQGQVLSEALGLIPSTVKETIASQSPILGYFESLVIITRDLKILKFLGHKVIEENECVQVEGGSLGCL